MAISQYITRINEKFARSRAGRYFKLEGSGHPLERTGSNLSTEIRAGAVTFAAMAYIISVNASILSSSGGPCQCPNLAEDPVCSNDVAYQICTSELQRDYVVATSAISAIATGLMGLLAHMPLGLSSGLGVNAYFAFTIVGVAGTGLVTYSEALAAIFLEGLLFFFLSLIGLRQALGRLLPRSITLATSTGIGLYLALIGLGPNGISLVGGNYSDLIGLGGCIEEYQDENGYCTSHVLQNPTVWLGVFLGGIMTALLLLYRVKGALLIPIFLVAIVSWPRNSAVTYFPHTDAGDSAFDFFKKVATFHSFKHLGPSNIDFQGYSNGRVWIAVISFLYIDILDTTGTLYAMSRHAGLMDDTTGDFEGSSVAYLVDAGCITIGSLMGLSPSTAFIESASGIAEGGKTGITAITTAFLFFLSLFFAPIFASIPSWATGSTLIIVGSMMASSATQINWDYYGDSIPAFITIIGIPFTFNIAYGLIGSIISWILLHNIPKLISFLSGGRITVPGVDTLKEPYSISRMGTSNSGETGFRTILPPWLRKLVYNRDTKFWRMSEAEIEAYREGRKQTQLRALHRAEQRERDREEMRGNFNPSALHESASYEKEKEVEALEDGSGGDDRVNVRDH